jgi:hypothetical protein
MSRAPLITDEHHPEMQQALQELITRLEFYLGHDVSRGLFDSYFRIVKEHRARWRTKGVDFPALVVIVVPRLGVIELKRADLSKESILVSVLNFVREYPQAQMEEVVAAFRAAYPTLHPDDIAQYGAKALARRPSVQ